MEYIITYEGLRKDPFIAHDIDSCLAIVGSIHTLCSSSVKKDAFDSGICIEKLGMVSKVPYTVRVRVAVDAPIHILNQLVKLL